MRDSTHRLFGLLATSLLLLSVTTSARAADMTPDPSDTSKMCSMEEGARLRSSGKLKDAGSFYLTCRESCAHELHHECERSAQEVLAATPTILIMAKDSRGNNISDVSVTIDGKIAISDLDGRAISIDPGPHTVVLERKGAAITQQINAAEGMKDMPVKVMFKGKDPDAVARDMGGHTIWPWAVVGFGAATIIAGIAVVATAPVLPDGCDKETKVCQPKAGENTNSASFNDRRNEAGQATDQPKIGALVIGLGAAIAIGGVVWHFVEPTEPRSEVGQAQKPTRVGHIEHITATPWFGQNNGGVGLSGRF